MIVVLPRFYHSLKVSTDKVDTSIMILFLLHCYRLSEWFAISLSNKTTGSVALIVSYEELERQKVALERFGAEVCRG
ncbi:hypothetical protein BK411_22075 [Vibrio splendidus]|nr:hypothetical protein BK411_22075 [Vibrio splendidus]